jgi:hypothetical protein
MRKLSIVTLVLMGFGLVAGEPVDTGSESLIFKGARAERKILKVKDRVFSGKSYMREEDREPHGPGLFANFALHLPANDYMDPYYGGLFHDGTHYKPGVAFEIGNYFRFFHTDRLGVGLRATWIQLGYNAHQDTAYFEGNAFGSPIRLGPQASYLIGENMGIDAFYQLGAQYNIAWYGGENLSYLGLTHEVGIGLRYMFFTAGAAYKFGAIPNIDSSDETVLWLDEDTNYPVTGIRIFLGIQL